MEKSYLGYMNDELQKKKVKRDRLEIRRRSNMHRALIIVAFIIIAVGIGNYFYERYEEKLYHDKRIIMQNNENLVWNLQRRLEYTNDIIIDLLFDKDVDKAYARGRLQAGGDSAYSLRYFRYDYDVYDIDDYYQNAFMQDLTHSVTEVLNKEGVSDSEKESLAEVLKFNKHLIDTIREIHEVTRESEHREAIEYLYYYKGEACYLLNSAISVYMDGIDPYFVEEDIGHSVEAHSDEDESLTLEEAKIYVDQFNEIFFDGQLELELPKDYSIQESIVSERVFTVVGSDENQREPEAIRMIGVDNIGYNIGYEIDEKHGKDKALSSEVLGQLAQSYVDRLNQPMLQLENEGIHTIFFSNDKESQIYDYHYIIKGDGFTDRTYSFWLRLLPSGKVVNLQLSGIEMMSEPYRVKGTLLSEEEAIGVLPLEIQRNVISIRLDVARENQYVIEFIQYNMMFTVYVSSETGDVSGYQ